MHQQCVFYFFQIWALNTPFPWSHLISECIRTICFTQMTKEHSHTPPYYVASINMVTIDVVSKITSPYLTSLDTPFISTMIPKPMGALLAETIAMWFLVIAGQHPLPWLHPSWHQDSYQSEDHSHANHVVILLTIHFSAPSYVLNDNVSLNICVS